MNKKIWSGLLLLTFLFALSSCAPDDPGLVSVNPDDLQGHGDPVVAIGNSLTAGVVNGGLMVPGQLQSYTNRVANQFLEGIAEGVVVDPRLPSMAISMPLVKDGIGTTSGQGPLYVSATGGVTSDALTANPEDLLLASGLLQPYGNLGVPGALTLDVTLRLGAGAPEGFPLPDNPFFDIVLRNSALPFNEGTLCSELTPNGTQLGQYLQIIKSVESTTWLTMLWIGNNDILGFATSGSDAVAPPAQFEAFLTPVVAEVERSAVPMVAIANIPYVTSIPFFTTIVGLLGQGGLTPADINTDEANVALITLKALSYLFPGGALDPDYLDPGSGKSVPAEHTLTGTEFGSLTVSVDAYNAIIAAEAAKAGRNWALVDLNAELAGLSPFPDNDVLNSAYPWLPTGQNKGAAFGLDGVHPSEKGYARIANTFIEAINLQYGPVLGAVRGGPMNTVDESLIQNIIGFELAPTPRPGMLDIDESAQRALEDVMAIGR
jgi:hypothetical protein